MKKYSTVIFDLDGTLLDTLDDMTNSVNYVMSHFGYPLRSREEIRSFVGNGIRNLIIKALPNGEDNSNFEKAFSMYKEYYTSHCLILTKPYNGIADMLNSMSGYNMAIVSNKNNEAVGKLNKLFFSEYIEVAIGEKPGVNRKPAPDTLYEAMRIYGADKESTLYVGDSEVDILTANNAGVDCVLVSWGFRDRAILEKYSPVGIIDKPSELLNIIV